jgi:hypothetical protein
MTLDNLVGKGLEKAEADALELSRYVEKIQRKINDSRNASNHLDTRFDIAFEALLQVAICALRANGYRTTSDAGHQQRAIQLLPRSLGIDQGEIRALDEYRKKRSLGLYEADFDPSEREVEAVTAAVQRLHRALIGWLRKNRPDMRGKV